MPHLELQGQERLTPFQKQLRHMIITKGLGYILPPKKLAKKLLLILLIKK